MPQSAAREGPVLTQPPGSGLEQAHNSPPPSSGWPAAVRRTVEAIDHWHALILLLAAPFFLFPAPARTPLLLVLPALWLAARLAGRPSLPRTPLNAALLLFSVMLLVSLFATFDVAFSLAHIAGVLLGLGAYFAIVRQVRRPAHLWRAIELFVLAGAGLVLLGLVGIDWLDKLSVLAAITSRLPVLIRGLPGAEEGFSSNGVSGALIFLLPLQVALLVASLRQWPQTPQLALLAARPRLWLAVQVALLAWIGGLVLLAQSRGAWFGLLIGLLLLLGWQSRRGRWLVLGVLVLAGLAVAVAGLPALAEQVARAVNFPLGDQINGRRELWLRALELIRDYPLTGTGLNGFRAVVPVLYPIYRVASPADVVNAHDHLLQAAADLGLPGLIAYLALWIGGASALVSAYRASRDPWLRAVAQGLAAGLLAGFVWGFTDVISFGAKLGIFFWFALALSIAVYQVTREA